jgi:hypothetical protein
MSERVLRVTHKATGMVEYVNAKRFEEDYPIEHVESAIQYYIAIKNDVGYLVEDGTWTPKP